MLIISPRWLYAAAGVQFALAAGATWLIFQACMSAYKRALCPGAVRHHCAFLVVKCWLNNLAWKSKSRRKRHRRCEALLASLAAWQLIWSCSPSVSFYYTSTVNAAHSAEPRIESEKGERQSALGQGERRAWQAKVFSFLLKLISEGRWH